MTRDPCLIYPDTILYPWTIVYPGGFCPPTPDYGPGGGGFGAVMSDAHFQRYKPSYQSRLRKQAPPSKRRV